VEPTWIRCPQCGAKLGQLVAGEVISRIRVRVGARPRAPGEEPPSSYRTCYGPRRIDCERCTGHWEAAAAPAGEMSNM